MNVAKNHNSTAYTAQLGIHGDLLYRDTFLRNTINSYMGNEVRRDKMRLYIEDYIVKKQISSQKAACDIVYTFSL